MKKALSTNPACRRRDPKNAAVSSSSSYRCSTSISRAIENSVSFVLHRTYIGTTGKKARKTSAAILNPRRTRCLFKKSIMCAKQNAAMHICRII